MTGVVPRPLGVGFPPTYGALTPVYNPTAMALHASSWPAPSQPQPWFPPNSVALISPPPAVLAQQPLFPVQSVPTSLTTAATALQPLLHVLPLGLSTSTLTPLAQPLFPVDNMSASQVNSSSTNVTTAFNTSNNQGSGAYISSHMYASGPNTSGPAIGPPPVISNKAPCPQPAINEVYLVWDDEVLSMEERRLSLGKYQVHDETSQMNSVNAAIDRRISESRLAGRMPF